MKAENHLPLTLSLSLFGTLTAQAVTCGPNDKKLVEFLRTHEEQVTLINNTPQYRDAAAAHLNHLMLNNPDLDWTKIQTVRDYVIQHFDVFSGSATIEKLTSFQNSLVDDAVKGCTTTTCLSACFVRRYQNNLINADGELQKLLEKESK